MIKRLILFLIINFGALAIGGLFTNSGVSSAWSQELNIAPWSPPGWVFGFAWTSIMICFSIYMAYLWPSVKNRQRLVILFIVQWILNVGWNPVFFYYHHTAVALLIIVMLSILVGFFLFFYRSILKLNSLFILPYFIWLLIATSLNAYILLYN